MAIDGWRYDPEGYADARRNTVDGLQEGAQAVTRFVNAGLDVDLPGCPAFGEALREFLTAETTSAANAGRTALMNVGSVDGAVRWFEWSDQEFARTQAQASVDAINTAESTKPID